MKYLIFLFLFLSLNNDFKSVKNIPVKSDYFLVDVLGNCYLVDRQEVKKYDNFGRELCTYSNGSLGNITYVDASNPLKILLLYKNFNQIILLDNSFAELTQPFYLDNIGIDNIDVACTGNFGGIWIYNSTDMELQLYNKGLNLEQTGTNLSSLINGNQTPNFLIEKNDNIYLNFPKTGILVFDNLGVYNKTIPIKGLKRFDVSGTFIRYFKENKIHNYNYLLMSETIINLPDTINVTDAAFLNNNLYIYKKDWLSLYHKSK